MRPSQVIKLTLCALPLVEIAGFVVVGKILGLGWTLLLVIASTVGGITIMRTQGFTLLMQVNQRMQAGEQPAAEMLEGALLMLGGLLLIIPGFVTSTVGVLLVIPSIRQTLLRKLVKAGMAAAPRSPTRHGNVIEGEFRRKDDDN